MDTEKLTKMLDKGYQSEDAKIAKLYLIAHHKDLIEEGNDKVKFISGERLSKLGINTRFLRLSLHKVDFPELWEK